MFKAQIEKLTQSKGFKKYFANTSWLLGGKLLQMMISFFVTAYVGKFLGPELFGTLNYSKSVVQLVLIFIGLGLTSINIRNLVKNPNDQRTILGTAIFLRLGSAIVFTISTMVVVQYMPNHQPIVNMLIYVMCVSTFFKAFHSFDDYFQSQVKAEYGVKSRFISTMIFAAFQFYLIQIKADLIWFGVAFAVRHVAMGLTYLIYYSRHYGWPGKLRVSKTYIRELMTDAWPLMFSSFVIFLYMKADQMMLKHFSAGGSSAADINVGQYTAALRVSEVWFFLGPVLTGSLFPAIINARERGKDFYYKRLRNFFDLMVWLAFGITIPMVLFGPTVLQWEILFGSKYAAAGEVLVIHSWTLVFVFLGNASSKYLVAENLQKITLYRTVLGAIVNLALNYYLIPLYGVKGAAVATLISQAVASYLSYGFSPITRDLFQMMSRSLFLIGLFTKIGERIRKR